MADKPVSPSGSWTADTARALGKCLRPAIIAIDGPAASGKSTVGYSVANLLDYLYFDTGIMYRAVTWAALTRQVTLADEPGVTQLAGTVDIDLAAPDPGAQDGRQCTVLLDGVDITWPIRTPEVDRSVSVVAAYPGVRAALTVQQRRIAERYGRGDAGKPGIVMVGRDIGTVVIPTATVKVYMDATAAERARRRHLELVQRGKQIPYAEVLRDIERRDQVDTQRAVSPLRPASDALIVDTTTLTPEGVVDRVLTLIQDKVRNLC